MKYGISIGNEISMKEAAEPIAKALVEVLAAISGGRIEREVAIEALRVLGLSAGVQGAVISDCTVTSSPFPKPTTVINHYGDDEEDGA